MLSSIQAAVLHLYQALLRLACQPSAHEQGPADGLWLCTAGIQVAILGPHGCAAVKQTRIDALSKP